MSTSVDALITDARSFAKDAFAQTATLVQTAESAISEFTSTPLVISKFTLTEPEIPALDAVPEFNLPDTAMPSAPVAPTIYTQLPTLDFGDAPVNTAVAPVLLDPAIPNQLRQFELTAPAINTDLAFPTVPDELQQITFAPPTMGNYTAPDAPSLAMPSFDGVRPDDTLAAPGDYAAEMAANYRDIAPVMMDSLDAHTDQLLAKINPRFADQMNALEDKLSAYLAGGTGLAPAIENAIYERSRAKVNAEAGRARDVAFLDAAKRGFTLPNGTLVSAIQKARQAGLAANAAAAVEIAVNQAELEQKNLQFAMSTSLQLRSTVLNAAMMYHTSLVTINGQAVSYAQAVMNAAIEVYNAMVRAYTARLEAYKADAMVYQTRMQAVSVAAEIYRSEIAAMEALVRVDQAKIEIYRSRLESLNVLASVYRSRIDAIIAQANVEKLKIELFSSQVSAYGVEAQAKASEFQGYSALVNGQEARMRVYGEEVRAYSANVDAYRAKVAAKTAEVQSAIEVNRNLTQTYVANIEGYRALVDAKAKTSSIVLDFAKTKLVAYSAKVNAEEANARLAQEYYRTKATLGLENYRAVSTTAIESARLSATQIESTARTALGGAQVYQGLAAAALGGINTLVSSSS